MQNLKKMYNTKVISLIISCILVLVIIGCSNPIDTMNGEDGSELSLTLHKASSTTPSKPFPQSIDFPNTIKPNNITQTQLNQDIVTFFTAWKSDYLEQGPIAGGYYIASDYTGTLPPSWGTTEAVTCSEAHGYGMIVFALMAGHDPNAKTIYDGMYQVYNSFRSTTNSNLMSWIVPADGDTNKRDNSATDGDMDIAYSLLLAHTQWGSNGAINYLNEAKRIINAIQVSNVVDIPGTHYPRLNICDAMGPDDLTRPSDFMVGHTRAFYEATNNTIWSDVESMIFTLVNATRNTTTGLVPDFIVNDPGVPAQPNELEGPHDGDYYWNACRFPWRIALGHAHYGMTDAQPILNSIVTWLKPAISQNPDNIKAGYTLTGAAINTYGSNAYTAPFITASIVSSSHQSFLNSGWTTMKSSFLGRFNDWGSNYFGDTINLLNMLLVSGNWWAPEMGTTTPTTPTPTATMIPDPDPVTNLISNGDFSNGLTGWSTYVDTAANASVSVMNNELKAYITSGGTDLWMVNAEQSGLTIENGKKYKVTFDARALSSRSLQVIVLEYGSPWTCYSGYQSVNLSTSMVTYSYTFTMTSPTDTNAKLEFDFGGNNADVYIDNVKLEEVVETQNPTPTATPTAVAATPTPTATPTATAIAQTPTPTATPTATAIPQTPTPTAGGSDPCAGVAAWDPAEPWTNYTVGDLRTNSGKLYQCTNVAYSFYEPSGPSGHFGWAFVDNCN